MPIPVVEKKAMLVKLLAQYKVSSDTKMVLFAHADLNLPGTDPIDEEVLLALSGYLKQHTKENPCLVTTPGQLQEVLEVLAANKAHGIKLVALGHYCAGLEIANAYKFVNSIAASDYLDDFADHLYFATILNNHSLHGSKKSYRSINITGDYRLIYELYDIDTARLIDIDTHSNLY